MSNLLRTPASIPKASDSENASPAAANPAASNPEAAILATVSSATANPEASTLATVSSATANPEVILATSNSHGRTPAAQIAHVEKSRAAILSVFWAFFLTVIKLITGLATNSLGLLSEALHSALDLVAAGITWVAVHFSGKPADSKHNYGYGKIENLSALIETILLLLTCGWIVREAIERLFFEAPEILPSWWGIGVILISLAVDINRSKMLMAVAKKHKSQALEADALHFSTDIWSSAVVLVGLLGVQISTLFNPDTLIYKTLHMFDAIAALCVAAIVVMVSFKLSKKAVSALLDGGGAEHAEAIEQAITEALPLVKVVRSRVRESGAQVFMDLTVQAPASLRLEAAHELAQEIEDLAANLVPNIDLTVHVEPSSTENSLDVARELAKAFNLSIHNLILTEQPEGLIALLHVEADPNLSLGEAHELTARFERRLYERLHVVHVETHVEPLDRFASAEAAPSISLKKLQADLEQILPKFPLILETHDMRWITIRKTQLLCLHCVLPSELNLAETHEIITQLEHDLRSANPGLERLLIHADPQREVEAKKANNLRQ